jgi:hypothetical protein
VDVYSMNAPIQLIRFNFKKGIEWSVCMLVSTCSDKSYFISLGSNSRFYHILCTDVVLYCSNWLYNLLSEVICGCERVFDVFPEQPF